MSTSSEPHRGDMKAGFLGLIIGGLIVAAILLSIVKITHDHYASATTTEQAG
ncbi:MAG TPA: hypothetical protein VFK16_03205 [Gemmatimonadaceae bacterium]|jgi:hypothetical protein|nr:hypothetical protein [Gemmatimonadaceae bacterium]